MNPCTAETFIKAGSPAFIVIALQNVCEKCLSEASRPQKHYCSRLQLLKLLNVWGLVNENEILTAEISQ